MKKVFLIISALLAVSACNKTEEGLVEDPVYVCHLRLDVQDMETKAIYHLNDHTMTWEEGDVISLSILGIDPDFHDVFIPAENKMFNIKGKLINENGSWITYINEGGEFVKRETVELRTTCKNTRVDVDFNFSYMNSENGHGESRWHRGFDFQEGELTMELNLAELFVESDNNSQGEK